jgi:hypothetical protein
MKKLLLWRFVFAIALPGLAACTSAPQRQVEWSDPALGPNSRLLGERVLVACEAYDAALRQVCEDRLSRELAARGATPVRVPPATSVVSGRELDGQLIPSATAAGAKAVLVVSLTPATWDAGSGMSLGIGGFSFGRNSAAGVGLGLPISTSAPSTGFSANGRVTEVSSGRMVWTSTFVAQPSGDLGAQFGDLSRAMVDAAHDAGML